jgi:hypothetical protein
VGGKEGGGEEEGEMTQTLYAHMNKKEKKRTVQRTVDKAKEPPGMW